MLVKNRKRALTALTIAGMGCTAAQISLAATWSDTSISARYGSTFAEPFNANDISKTILGLTHASGFEYGSNFFNVDMLMSDDKDAAASGKSGAQEVYVVYRNSLDIGKLTGQNFQNQWIKSLGWTNGFDFNSKNDFYASKKRMFVTGPTIAFNVPKGFVDLSLLALFESNSPSFINKRYTYDTHPAVNLAWGVPVMPKLSFQGYAMWIAEKGKNESGDDTAAETHFDASLMYDIGSAMTMKDNQFKIGVEYEYWHNKFGNSEAIAGSGATASTPMIRAEYHF